MNPLHVDEQLHASFVNVYQNFLQQIELQFHQFLQSNPPQPMRLNEGKLFEGNPFDTDMNRSRMQIPQSEIKYSGISYEVLE